MYIDPITKQSFNHATPLSCNKKTPNVIALARDSDENYVLTTKPVLWATFFALCSETSSIRYKHKHIHCRRSWNLFRC